MSGNIASVDSMGDQNTTYTLTFRGPVLQCSQTTIGNETILYELAITNNSSYWAALVRPNSELAISEFEMGLKY